MSDTTLAVGASRRTVEEAGTAYINHLEHVMERKRTVIADYRGYLRKHLVPFFAGRPLDKIARAASRATCSREARRAFHRRIQNHLHFLHGIFSFSIKRVGRRQPRRPRQRAAGRRARRTAAFAPLEEGP